MKYLNTRTVLMLCLVFILHVRYIGFKGHTLSIILAKRPLIPKLVRLEDVCTVVVLNDKVTHALRRIGIANEFCMKSSTVLALCTRHLENVQLVIGVDKENSTQGHAWVERDEHIISSDSRESLQQYTVVKRIEFESC